MATCLTTQTYIKIQLLEEIHSNIFILMFGLLHPITKSICMFNHKFGKVIYIFEKVTPINKGKSVDISTLKKYYKIINRHLDLIQLSDFFFILEI